MYGLDYIYIFYYNNNFFIYKKERAKKQTEKTNTTEVWVNFFTWQINKQVNKKKNKQGKGVVPLPFRSDLAFLQQQLDFVIAVNSFAQSCSQTYNCVPLHIDVQNKTHSHTGTWSSEDQVFCCKSSIDLWCARDSLSEEILGS